ncbi:GTPase-activating protein and VPS9 domain-containing protein 1 isoform X3 [Centruroides vittatus]|uniref:GTPase-activating protein and VPS9 domain-containing protein 1 isoform X3 n=1 Tax=Centruroides vittatus TaxID=120091 RepID=UPI00350EA471
MKHKSLIMGSSNEMNLLELAHHLRQEYLFVSSEREHLQHLNEKVMKTVEHLYHLSWIAKQQRINLENLILSRVDSHPAACCQYANALERVNFIDSYKTLGNQDGAYSEFLQQFREDPKLIAMCLSIGEKINIEQMQNIVHIIMSAIYGNNIIPEDEIYVLRLLKELMALQLATSENPRRLLRHGSCAFGRVYKTFSESLFSAKLFLTGALHEPIMHLLMEDDLFLDIDPDKAVVRFPPQERLRHFGKEGTQEYLANLQRYRSWTIDKLVKLTKNFIEGIQNNMYCFPQSLSWLVRQMFNLVMKAKKVEVREVGAMCADLIFAFFICPAIVTPEPYGITDAPISHIARFNLMQVAQILQVLAMSKWEEIDLKLMDLYGKFEKNCMSSLLDLILEGSTNDSPSEFISELQELNRSAILMTESELLNLVSFLCNVEMECKDELLKKSLNSLLGGLPSYSHNSNQNSNTPYSGTPNATPMDTPPNTPSSRRSILGKVGRITSKTSLPLFTESHHDDCNLNETADTPVNITTQVEEVLVIPLANQDFECPGMLSEEKVISLEQQKKHSKVRMNLDSLVGDENDNVSTTEIVEKKTRFSLSQDQESLGTSDNLEAVSEAASNHSVASSLDLENENENDNLSDMVSANVSGRGTPNVSGRDTPSSQLEGEEREQRPLDLPVATQKQNREDIEDKFGRFEIKEINEGDETKSMVSDTWSTDVLASDSETIEQSDASSQIALEVQPPGLLDVSETASQSDAWSMDVLTSDTERLQDLDTDDTSSVARSDDTTRSEIEGEHFSEINRPDLRELSDGTEILHGTSTRHYAIIKRNNEFLNSEETVKMFDPLSVNTEQHEYTNTTMQDDLTPTGNLSTFSQSDKMHHTTSVQENRIAMQSLGRLSLAVNELPDNEGRETVISLLDTLQGSAFYSADSGDRLEKRRTSIADILSLDLNKTLNLASEESYSTSAEIKKTNSGNLDDFEFKEILDVDTMAASNLHIQDNEIKKDNLLNVCDNVAENGGMGFHDTSRLSSASISSTSSSTCSTDICVKNTVLNSNAMTNEETSLSSTTVDITSFQNRRHDGSSEASSMGAIPKSISFDKSTSRLSKLIESDEKSGEKNRKSFFKLSNFKFNFKAKNRKSHSMERQDTVQKNETGDEILAKYRKKPAANLESNSISHGDVGISNFPDSSLLEDGSNLYDPLLMEHTFSFIDAKKKLRLVFGSSDMQTVPWSTSWGRSFGGSNLPQKNNDLVALLNVLLAEAINLQQRPLMAHLHEALRCVKTFDDASCQKLFKSLKEDYKSRASYIAYLVRCRQGLLSTLARLESLMDRVERDKLVCSRYLVSLCVRAFLEKKERTIEVFIRKFQALTVSDEKAHLVEKFLHYLFSNMELDPTWHGASEVQLEYAQSVIERTIMSQIYIHAMYPNGDGDKLRDHKSRT